MTIPSKLVKCKHYARKRLTLCSLNLTLRFFQDSQGGSCGYSNSSDALTFTTSTTPVTDHCFNLEELATGNATSGFINQTDNLSGQTGDGRDVGIRWALKNAASFDPQGNYSSLLYRQYNSASSDDDQPGGYASTRVTVYGFADCNDIDPNGGDLGADTHWYGFSCLTEAEGDCGTLPLPNGAVSFRVQPGLDPDEDPKCETFAANGDAASLGLRTSAVMGVVAAGLVAVWMSV